MRITEINNDQLMLQKTTYGNQQWLDGAEWLDGDRQCHMLLDGDKWPAMDGDTI